MMSNIPLLYCLLYYRADQQLKPAERSSYFQSHLEGDSLSQLDGIRNQTILNTLSHATFDTPWIYHSRRTDMNRLCYNANIQATEGTNGHGYSSDVCYVKALSDIGKIFPQGFTSEHELHKIILRLNWAGTTQRHVSNRQTMARYVMNPHASAALKAEVHGSMPCGVCLTEVGYEIIAEVTDFNGKNHTVINLHNAYQFIPSGKCLNENSPCSGSLARCKQVYRAHWTLVWSSLAGLQLIAHEVPSHCECINFGGSPQPSSFVNAGQSANTEDAGV